MLGSPVRRTVPLALIGLAAGLLPLVVTVAPAQASASCKDERALPFPLGCDDENPPVTDAVTLSVSGTTLTATSSAHFTDTDADTLGYQCQLDGGSWSSCHQVASFSNLSAGAHTLAVRAADVEDNVMPGACDLSDCSPEVPDYDTTPQTASATIGSGGGRVPGGPNGEPETQISGGPRDEITPGAPVALTRSPQVTLASSEPATFNCAVNARRIPCRAGVTVLKGLKPGNQVLVAQAVDTDGNYDATPASFAFYVPVNLKPGQGTGWKTVKSRRAYAGDYVSTSIRGAVLTVGSVKGVREVRLIAPTGPNLGKVAVRIGHGKWQTVDLKSAKAKKLEVFVIRGPRSGPVSGAIQFQALKVPSGGAVAVDAIVAR